MSAGEVDESQAGYEDSAPGGPGAPTPLSALEVPSIALLIFGLLLIILGNQRTDETRYRTNHRGWIQHSGISSIYVGVEQ